MRTKILVPVIESILASFLFVGCATPTFTLKHSALPAARDRREGEVSVAFIDKRDDKTKIGIAGQGRLFAQHGDIVTKEKLETTLARAFSEVLEKAGYSVAPTAKVTVEGEIREFHVEGNPVTQHAKERIRVRLRDCHEQILWETSLEAEDGGMVDFFPVSNAWEKSMNVAFDRLLSKALEEFTSEFFYQCVKKATTSQ